MTDVDLAQYEMESLVTYAQHLNAICNPDPNALPKYDIWAGALIWPDETNASNPIEVIWALRQLRNYRTYVMLNNESPNPTVWDACKSLFPDWVGFRPERCISTPELVECYRREEISSRWCLRKFEREMDGKTLKDL